MRLRWRKFGENNSIYHLADFSRGRAGKLLHGRRYKNRTNSETRGRRRDTTVPCWNMHIIFSHHQYIVRKRAKTTQTLSKTGGPYLWL